MIGTVAMAAACGHLVRSGHRQVQAVASWITVAIVIVVLLVAGLQALVVGKAFGTPFDFLLAFTWGAGSALIAQLLAPAIEGLARITPTPT